MHKQCLRFTFFLLICLTFPLAATAQVVSIPDPNLRIVIEERLGKASGATITTTEMATLTHLDARNSNISDLTGLAHAINLTSLHLSSNSISDISLLGRLTNLTWLYLRHNSISDISLLGGLTNLTLLSLSSNLISDISSLSGLSNLTSLGLSSNSISDISSLGGLTNLTELSLDRNSISDLSAVAGLTNLTRLSLWGNSISDISSLLGLTNLKLLSLSFNSISDILSLGGLTNLTWLDLNSNLISDISSLESLTNLTSLSLDRNSISDISALVTNRGLGSGDAVNVKFNPLSSVSIDAHIPVLQSRGVTVAFDDIIPGVEVEFPDSNLRAAIESALGRASGAPITTSDMALLTRLDARESNIINLTGLEHAINLTRLYLDGNSISDITSLSGLTNLTWLSLGYNSISDISALVINTGLGNGDTVNVKGNPLSSVSIDTHIPVLQSRGVTVRFDDIVPGVMVDIPDANLRAAIELVLGKVSGDPITTSDMAALTQLDASNSNIIDLTGLEHAINLTELKLLGNSISDISSLSGLTNLTRLDLSSNLISDISSLGGLTNLTWLSLWGNSISDISSLAGLTNLRSLNLSSNSISGISSLGSLTNLTWLYLRHNSISDISSLRGLTNLTWLYLRHNLISDPSAVAGLTNLRSLDLSSNSISDISSLGGLTNLTELLLSSNSISDISSLGGLTNLTELSLWGNSVSDLSALVTNTGLGNGDTVNVRVNPLSSVSINTHISVLHSRGVTVRFDDIVAGVVVEFPDANLRAVIEEALGKASGDTIMTSDMAALTRLEANNSNISDLTGLEGAINLRSLNLGSNSISDISLLGGLTNLTRLNLWYNSISDISSLLELTNLRSLNLGSNSISDISSLAGLINLTELDLWGNSISDISSLAGLTNLRWLSLNRNSISDLSALVTNTGLESGGAVNVKVNPLSSISIDTHIPVLRSRGVTVRFDDIVAGVVIEFLDANLRAAIEAELGKTSGSPITTSDMAVLSRLDASNSNIIDLTGLEHAINLRWLNLGGNSISNILALSGLTDLTRLDLWRNSISDISSLVELINLTELSLDRNSISNILSLGELTNLTELSLGGNSISDISSLGELTNLTELSLWDNSISDISSLAGLTNLTTLWLWGNSISDISSLSGLANLTELSLWDNSISNLSALVTSAGLGSGDTVDVKGNPLSSVSIDTHIPVLESRGVSVEFDDIVAGVVVEFLDSNLRSVIEGELGKGSGDTITTSDMAVLIELDANEANISDLTGLEHAINLRWLSLRHNLISDISSLAGLTNLTSLNLGSNSISDLSALVANTGLESGDRVYLQGNSLSYISINTHIPTLQSRGVTVSFDNRTPTRLVKISGDNQKEAAFAPLPHPFVVEMKDERGQPFAGVSVIFTVTEGGGTLSITHTTTDADGRAESTLTLGPNLGTNTVSVSAPEIEKVETFNAISDTLPTEYRLSIPTGISLIHVPLKVTAVDGAEQTIESIAELYDALGGASTVNFLITYDSSIQEWLSYFVPSDKGTLADVALTDDTGIIAGLKSPTSVRLKGDALGIDGSSSITLSQGLNLVGLPLRDPRIARVSDLFALEGIGGNVPVIILTDRGEFQGGWARGRSRRYRNYRGTIFYLDRSTGSGD